MASTVLQSSSSRKGSAAMPLKAGCTPESHTMVRPAYLITQHDRPTSCPAPSMVISIDSSMSPSTLPAALITAAPAKLRFVDEDMTAVRRAVALSVLVRESCRERDEGDSCKSELLEELADWPKEQKLESLLLLLEKL